MLRRTRVASSLLAVGLAAGMATGVVVTSLHGATPTTQAASLPAEHVNLVIVPDSLRGPDKKTHDAYVPSSLTAKAGQQVTVTIYNLDTAPHSFTSPALHLNVIVPAAKGAGLEGTATFSFTAAKAGTYHWKCILPCDNGGVNAWAMTHDGYMAGTVTIQ